MSGCVGPTAGLKGLLLKKAFYVRRVWNDDFSFVQRVSELLKNHSIRVHLANCVARS